MSDFLYPFLDGGGADADALRRDLATSAESKGRISAELLTATLASCDGQLDALAGELAERIERGARVWTFGNGGSATDAAGVASLLRTPPWGRPVPARTLVAEPAVLTALGNDIGFDVVYARQLIAHARAEDVAVGMSTSGNSANVMAGLAEARRRGLLTVGLAGYDGGAMATSGDLAHCLVVRSDSIHRIQETQAGLVWALWCRLQDRLVTATAGKGAPA